MFRAILILSLFIGTDSFGNSSYLGNDCQLNKTQPDLIFDKCERIKVTDLTSYCPTYDSVSCQTNPCFCDPLNLPLSYPCPEHFTCKWVKKSEPSGQILSLKAKILIGVGVVAFLLLAIGVIYCIYRWKRVCVNVTTSSNNRFYAVFHSNSDDSTIHCVSNDEINNETAV